MILYLSDTFNLHLHQIPILKEDLRVAEDPDPTGCPGQD
jgi:hypothetical protein